MDDAELLSPAEVERRVSEMLLGRTPASRDAWAALGPWGMRELVTLACARPDDERGNRLRAAALATLGQLAGVARLDTLLDTLSEPDLPVMVRCGVIEGLGWVAHPRVLPILQTQAYHAEFKVRLFACSALARLGTAGAKRVLEDVAERDPHSQVQRAAQIELRKAKGRAAASSETQTDP
jgi:HEAT repeat protein